MARKRKKNIEQEGRAQKKQLAQEVVYAKVPSGVPIAKPASNIQLTPIVQPVAFVPYSTSSQPLLVADEYEEYEEEY